MIWNHRLVRDWKDIFLAEVYYEGRNTKPFGYVVLSWNTVESCRIYLENKKQEVQNIFRKDSDEYFEELENLSRMEEVLRKEVLQYNSDFKSKPNRSLS